VMLIRSTDVDKRIDMLFRRYSEGITATIDFACIESAARKLVTQLRRRARTELVIGPASEVLAVLRPSDVSEEFIDSLAVSSTRLLASAIRRNINSDEPYKVKIMWGEMELEDDEDVVPIVVLIAVLSYSNDDVLHPLAGF